MPKLIESPAVLRAAGTHPKRIEEYAGRVNSGHTTVSAARKHDRGVLEVGAGQAVLTAPGQRVRYSTPGPDGAEYIAVCLPAFSPATVHRDA